MKITVRTRSEVVEDTTHDLPFYGKNGEELFAIVKDPNCERLRQVSVTKYGEKTWWYAESPVILDIISDVKEITRQEFHDRLNEYLDYLTGRVEFLLPNEMILQFRTEKELPTPETLPTPEETLSGAFKPDAE